MSDPVESQEQLGQSTRKWFAIASLSFFATIIVLVTFKGDPTNSLHQSAQSWSFTLFAGVIAGVGFGAITHLVPGLISKK